MSRFTFGAGNARVLMRAPLYIAGRVASRFVRRDDRLWVFGSGIGPGEGARALYESASRELPGTRLVWLGSTPEEVARARAVGMRAVRKDGWRGFRTTLRARVVVVTHGFGDVNRYAVTGALVVQLWHGIPLKKLHLDSPAALRLRPIPDHPLVRRALSVLYRGAGRQIGLFPAASALAAGRFETAFGLRDGVLAVTGDPRNDVLTAGIASERRATGRASLEAAVGSLPPTVLLYAPTWRDGDHDPGAPTLQEWYAIAGWLELHDAALLVRSHPLGVGDYADGPELSSRIRMLDSDRLAEIMPALPGVDTLITDYSSIAYDYSLTGGPIVFHAPDLARYEASRGLYEPYRDFSGGTHVSDWSGVLATAEGAQQNERLLRHSRRLRDEHFDVEHGDASGRVLGEILVRTGERAASVTASGRARLIVDTVQTTDATIAVSGPSAQGVPTAAYFAGQRSNLPGSIESTADRWTITTPLLVSRWGGPALPPPSGEYRLTVQTGGGSTVRFTVATTLPDAAVTDQFRLAITDAGGSLLARFAPPLTDAEVTGQRALERRYRTAPPESRNAVFFESFYSQVVACNPRAIDARLAAERPDVIRYWSTVDASVEIPDGAIRVIEGSAQWWDARAASRLLVVNDWLRKRYRRQPHQKVLQTWHGTMLKRLALDRPDVGARTRLAVLRERARWDILLAQNAYSARNFRSAYRFGGEIWEVGYPRDDVLLGRSATVRDRLGIPREARVVLYAPTWRDDRAEIVDFLDLPALALDLGENTVTLVRGHSRTLRHGRDIVGTRLLDVTTYPDVADLLAVTDVLVTDYSSLMFDYSSTGRPIVFFTPDLRHYGDELRGFYFDLHADAPGPVTDDQQGLLAAIESAGTDAAAHAERYEKWRARFNPHDDGHAAERVVRRILDAGLLD